MCTMLGAQERDIAGFEITLDQDHLADFLLESTNLELLSRNYTIGMRISVFGYDTDNDILGLPYVRKKIESFAVDPILDDLGLNVEQLRHDLAFITNGFTPQHISDENVAFQLATDAGYDLSADRPFSSFFGFRSSRRYEGTKIGATTGRKTDYALNSSFTFGIAGVGVPELMQRFFNGVDNFGATRPVPTLWDRDTSKSIPTGQALPFGFPLPMYSLSVESVIWKPIKTFQLQLRPDVNVGYYTNLGLGFDLGKVMIGERFIDNLGYTDTNNFSVLTIAKGHFAYSLVAGGSARLVLYNAHINGLFGLGDRHYIPFADTRKIVLEGYAGGKVQIYNYVEFTASISTRTPEIKSTNDQQLHYWATMTMKVILNEYN